MAMTAQEISAHMHANSWRGMEPADADTFLGRFRSLAYATLDMPDLRDLTVKVALAEVGHEGSVVCYDDNGDELGYRVTIASDLEYQLSRLGLDRTPYLHGYQHRHTLILAVEHVDVEFDRRVARVRIAKVNGPDVTYSTKWLAVDMLQRSYVELCDDLGQALSIRFTKDHTDEELRAMREAREAKEREWERQDEDSPF